MQWNNAVATVLGTEHLTDSLLRIRLRVGDGSGDGYVPDPAGDESVAFYLSTDGEEVHARQVEGSTSPGGWELVDPDRSAGHRNYTVRSFDPGTREMVVDVAEHSHGPGIDWIRAAEPGWRVLLAGPRSWYSPPAGSTHHVLAGDLAALPALARILEQTHPSVRVTAIAEVLTDADLDYLPAREGLTLVPLVGSGNGAAPSRLSAALTRLDLDDVDYCWFAGEASDSRAAKKHLRALGRGWDDFDVVGYWRENAEQWAARYAEVADRVQKVFQDALDSGLSRQEASALSDRALEEIGL